MSSRWSAFFIDGPARVVHFAWRTYWTIVAILTILCFVNLGFWVLLYLLGVPLP